MSEKSNGLTTDSDLKIAQELLASWGKKYSEEAVEGKVNDAYITLFEADRLQSVPQKLQIARRINAFINDNKPHLVEEYGELVSQIEDDICEIVETNGEGGITLLTLQQKLSKVVMKEDEVKDVELKVARFKTRILGTLKGTVADKQSIEIQELLDHLSDRLRGNEPFAKVMEEILNLLCSKLNLEGAALTYIEPLVKNVEFGEDDLALGSLYEGRVVKTSDVNGKDVEFAREKAINRMERIGNHSELVGIDVGNDKEFHYVTRVEIDGRDLGVLDFIVGSKDVITPEFITITKQVESFLDTLIEVGLQNLLERRLDQEVNRISVETKVSELPEALKRYLSLLGSIIGGEITFVYQPHLPDKTFNGFILKDGEIIEVGEQDDLGVIESSEKVYTRVLEDKRKSLRRKGTETRKHKSVGRIIVKSDKQISDADIALIDIVTNIIHQDVLTRNEKLESTIQGQGLLVAQKAIEGNLEWRGYHPIAVTMIDMEGSTSFDEDLEIAYDRDRYSDLINQLYKRMKDIEADPIAPSVFDKPEGDKVIYATGAPFTMDGKDVFGETNPHPGKYVAIALHNVIKIQKIWEEILDQDEKDNEKLPYRPKLCIGIEYSESARVGTFGMDEDDEESSRQDYTVLNRVSNIAARVQGHAKGGEILVSLAAWEKMQDFLNENELDFSIHRFVATGLPLEVIARNVANTIELVKVVAQESEEDKLKKQKELFKRKFEEVGSFGLGFESIKELPDGDYSIDMISSYKGPTSKMVLVVDDMPLQVLLPKDKLSPVDYPVSIAMHRKLLKQEQGGGFTNRSVLRIQHGRAVIVNYECIESLQTAKIADLLRESEENGRGIQINPEEVPAGEYKIIDHEARDGEHMYELKRMGAYFKVLIPESLINGTATDSGVLVYKSRRYSCRSESPEWEELV